MNKQLLAVLKYLFGIGLGVGLLYLAFRNIEFDSLLAELTHLQWGWLVPAIVIGTLSHWLRAARWTMLTRAAGYPTRTAPAFWSLMIGYTANYAVPRLGEITRCTMLSRSQGIPFMSAVGTVVVERAVDVVMLLVFLGITFLLEFTKLMAYFNEPATPTAASTGGLPGWVLYVVVGVAVGGLLAVLLLRRRRRSTKLGGRLWLMGQQLGQALLSVRKLRRVWLFLVYSFGIWACYVLFAWFMLFSLPSVAPYNTLLFAFFITMLGAIGMALPSLGGAGTFHGAVIIGFGLYNAPSGQAASLVLHTPSLIHAVLLGGIGYAVLLLQSRRKANAATTLPPPAEATANTATANN